MTDKKLTTKTEVIYPSVNIQRACKKEKICFIGPDIESIKIMGNKAASKRELIKLGYIASIRYGMAKPIPSEINIGNVTNEGCIKA